MTLESNVERAYPKGLIYRALNELQSQELCPDSGNILLHRPINKQIPNVCFILSEFSLRLQQIRHCKIVFAETQI